MFPIFYRKQVNRICAKLKAIRWCKFYPPPPIIISVPIGQPKWAAQQSAAFSPRFFRPKAAPSLFSGSSWGGGVPHSYFSGPPPGIATSSGGVSPFNVRPRGRRGPRNRRYGRRRPMGPQPPPPSHPTPSSRTSAPPRQLASLKKVASLFVSIKLAFRGYGINLCTRCIGCTELPSPPHPTHLGKGMKRLMASTVSFWSQVLNTSEISF